MKFNIRNVKQLKIRKITPICKMVTCIKQKHRKNQKYNRYYFKKRKIHLHMAENYKIENLKKGDIVKIGQTKRFLKIKSHVLL